MLFESLEERCLLTVGVFEVVNTNDFGEGSLRWAIEQANDETNDQEGPDQIHFSLSGQGPFVISPEIALPTITDSVVIDGYTQSEASANTLPPSEGNNAVIRIELDGSHIETYAVGLQIHAGQCTIRGLAIHDFESLIQLEEGDDNVVQGNYLGTDASGQTTNNESSQYRGIEILGSSGNLVGGESPAAANLIGGCDIGVEVATATSNQVVGNLVGIATDGSIGAPNVTGVWIVEIAYENQIQQNSISGNDGSGIAITEYSYGNEISGNLIVGNAGPGAEIRGYDNVLGDNDIRQNGAAGIYVTYSSAIGNEISGNLVEENAEYGVEIHGQNTIVSGNDILGNGGSGILLTGSQNSIVGNRIGLNEECGVLVHGVESSAIENQISQNQIGGNFLLGIDLSESFAAQQPTADGPTPNDPGDYDTGPNQFQNTPSIFQSPTLTNGELALTYFVDSGYPEIMYPLTVEFFVADTGSEGWLTYLGSDVYTVEDLDDEFKTVTFSGWPVFGGDWIYATATDAVGNTSEFSPGTVISAVPGIALDKFTNGVDTSSPNDLILPVGSEVVWTYEVSNPGNVPLTSVTVTDNQGVAPAYVEGDTNSNELLDPGELWVYSATGIVTERPYENLAVATGLPNVEDFPAVSDSDLGHYFGGTAQVTFVLEILPEDSEFVGQTVLPIGSSCEWVGEVTNMGNVVLGDIMLTVDDPEIVLVFVGVDADGDGLLDPGETWLFEATGIVTPGPHADLGLLQANPVDEEGNDLTAWPEVTATDDAPYTGAALSIQGIAFQDTDGNEAYDASEAGIPEAVIYLDLNDNGHWDDDEPSTLTSTDDPLTKDEDEGGRFLFEKLVPGKYVVRQLAPDGYVQSSPGAEQGFAHVVVVDGSETPIQVEFGNIVPPDPEPTPGPDPNPAPKPNPPPDPAPNPAPTPDLPNTAEPRPLLAHLFRPSGSLEPGSEPVDTIFPEVLPAALEEVSAPLGGTSELPDDLLRVLAESVTPIIHPFESGDAPPSDVDNLPELTPVDCELEELPRPEIAREDASMAHWRFWTVSGGLVLAALLIWRWQAQRRAVWKRALERRVVVGDHRAESADLDRRSSPWRSTSSRQNKPPRSAKESTTRKRV